MWQVQQFGQARSVALCLAVWVLILVYVILSPIIHPTTSLCPLLLIHPDIVFFGENLPVRFFTSMKMVSTCLCWFASAHARLKRMQCSISAEINSQHCLIYLSGLSALWSSHHHGDVTAGPAICRPRGQVLQIKFHIPESYCWPQTPLQSSSQWDCPVEWKIQTWFQQQSCLVEVSLRNSLLTHILEITVNVSVWMLQLNYLDIV